MKVCMIAGRDFFHPFDPRVYKEAKTLVENGYDVSIITPDKTDKEILMESIRVVCVKKSKTFGKTSLQILKKALKTKADVYHCHEFDPLLVGFFLKIFTCKKIVYDSHEDYPKMMYDNGMKLKSIYAWIIESFLCLFMAGIITPDAVIKQKFMRFNKNVAVVHNYPLQTFSKAHTKFNLKRFVYAGALTNDRGITKILAAFNRVVEHDKGAQLSLVGGFSDKKFENEVLTYIKSNGLNSYVKFTGWVNYRDMGKYLKGCGLCLLQPLPRYKNAVPTKLFEYMLCGLPVIVSNFPKLKEVVEKTDCGITVNPTNTTEIADAMIYMLNHPEKIVEMGKNGQKIAKEKFNWDITAETLINLYNNLKS